jgi:diadenosine tetraphosphatase ApaH/serine/threonine PP2A family protein phosphatase
MMHIPAIDGGHEAEMPVDKYLRIYEKLDADKIDVIGDIHGCFRELAELLQKLGYEVDEEGFIAGSPEGRALIFLGDFTDRGPEPLKVLRLAMDAVKIGRARSVRGNHEEKILQKLIKGTTAKEEVMLTLNAIKAEGPDFVRKVIDFIDGMPYVILCPNDILIAHGGLKEELQDLGTKDRKLQGRIKTMAIYGDITGRKLEDGRPERLDWAADYREKKTVIYGHTIIDRVEWRNNTVNIDTGCFRTGILTAVRMPEMEIVQNRQV